MYLVACSSHEGRGGCGWATRKGRLTFGVHQAVALGAEQELESRCGEASVTGKGRRSGPQWSWNGARFPAEYPKATRSQSLASGLCWAEDEPSDGAGPYGQPAGQSPGAQPAGGETVLTLAEAADYLKINYQRAAELVRRPSSRTVKRRDRQDEVGLQCGPCAQARCGSYAKNLRRDFGEAASKRQGS